MYLTTRRSFSGAVTSAGLALSGRTIVFGANAPTHKAPFKILFSNDTTHNISCPSPFHKRGAPFAAAGVDMVNASSHYFTDCQLEIAAMRRQLPATTALYAEVQFVTAMAQRFSTPDGKGMINANRRTTREQFDTVAHQAYAEGADGISAFNFQYYRGTFNPGDVYGEPAEPPYDVFRQLGNRPWLAQQPQHYFIGFGQGNPKKSGRLFNEIVKPGAPVIQSLFLVPPAVGWRKSGRRRIQGRASLGAAAGAQRSTALRSRRPPTFQSRIPRPIPSDSEGPTSTGHGPCRIRRSRKA